MWYNGSGTEGSMVKQLTAVYEKHGDWSVAYLEDIPGVNTQGKTKEEARANLDDALQEFLEANNEIKGLGFETPG